MNIDVLISLYNELQREGIFVFEYSQKTTKAVTIRNKRGYGIFIDTDRIETAKEELSVLAHEYGHCASGATHAVNSPLDLIEKHEYKADKYASHKLIEPNELKSAIENGCTEWWQLSERFGVTEEFLRRAVYIYQREGLLDG